MQQNQVALLILTDIVKLLKSKNLATCNAPSYRGAALKKAKL